MMKRKRIWEYDVVASVPQSATEPPAGRRRLSNKGAGVAARGNMQCDGSGGPPATANPRADSVGNGSGPDSQSDAVGDEGGQPPKIASGRSPAAVVEQTPRKKARVKSAANTMERHVTPRGDWTSPVPVHRNRWVAWWNGPRRRGRGEAMGCVVANTDCTVDNPCRVCRKCYNN